jgi:hypothetical protein
MRTAIAPWGLPSFRSSNSVVFGSGIQPSRKSACSSSEAANASQRVGTEMRS